MERLDTPRILLKCKIQGMTAQRVIRGAFISLSCVCNMKKLTDLLLMDEYSVYVWSSFLLAACILMVVTIVSFRALKRREKQLAEFNES